MPGHGRPVPGRPSPVGFQVMIKPVGARCNLSCDYCFYLEKERLYPGTSRWAMSDEVLESFTRQYLEASALSPVTFAWQGGEPTLLGVDFFRRAVELQKQHARGKIVVNTLQTNATLLDDAWGAFLAENAFLVGVSLDGPRELHDIHRRDGGGRPTFERVMRGLEVLARHGVAFNTLTVVHRGNQDHPLEVYDFLKAAGSHFMQFIPLVERVAEAPRPDGLSLVAAGCSGAARVTDASVEPLAFGRFLTAIFDEWVRHDVGRRFVQIFDVALQSWTGNPQALCLFAETCGAALALEHNGDLYPCDHFVYPEHLLGNVTRQPLAELAASARQCAFGDDKRDALPASCRRCEVVGACHGECPKRRFCVSPDGEPGLNHLCRGYRNFFRHVDPYMRFMAAELAQRRPPARVMQFARDLDAAAEVRRG